MNVSLHTADPEGDQSRHEASYPGYARGFCALDAGTNVDAVMFGKCTDGMETITHVLIDLPGGVVSRKLFMPLKVVAGITPAFEISRLTVAGAN